MRLAIYKLEDESKPLCILSEGTHSLGRGSQLGCTDKRISRNHVSISIEALSASFSLVHHTNPCYWRCADSTHLSLLKPSMPMEINDGDTFGFFPDIFWFKIKYFTTPLDENIDTVPTSSSTVPIQPEDNLNHSQPVEQDKPENNITNQVSDENVSENNAQEDTTNKTDCDSTTPQTTNTTNNTNNDNDDADQPSCSNTAKKEFKDRCWYGANCYRKSQSHRDAFSHPGDADYDTDPEDDRPACPYGRGCFRKNKDHRKEYKHSKQTVKPPNKRPGDPNNVLPTKRKRKTKTEQDLADYDDDFIDDEEEDAFATDEDEDFELDDSDSD